MKESQKQLCIDKLSITNNMGVLLQETIQVYYCSAP